MSYIVTLLLVLLSIIGIILLASKVKINSFVALLLVSLFLAFLTIPSDKILETLQEGFGKTMAYIGFLVIFGAIIGITLDKTGAMFSIANYILKKIGRHNAVSALGITGFLVGIPIFCDSGYIIMSSLAKSFSAKAKVSMPFMATVLAASLFAVHCLIPTHPGPLAGAGIMHAHIGSLIIWGLVFAIPGAIVAFFWSKFRTSGKNYAPYEEMMVESSFQKEKLPSVTLSLLPIVIPLMLILISSLLNLFLPNNHSLLINIFSIIGEPAFALLIGALLAILLLRDRKVTTLNAIFNEAIEKAGPILIITAAGGMFGMIIVATGIGKETGRILSGTGLSLVVPFLIALFLKTSQGSSTVAIITTASFVAPMLGSLSLDSDPGRLFAMLSIGAGSMVFSHANDSYFWVVSKFSDLDVDTTLKVYSSTTAIMGLVIFACIWVSSFFIL